MAIKDIKHKGLRELFSKGRTAKVARQHHRNALLILDLLDGATGPADCAGVKDFHALRGDRQGEYSMHVSGNWCITFEFDGQDVIIIDFEDYH